MGSTTFAHLPYRLSLTEPFFEIADTTPVICVDCPAIIVTLSPTSTEIPLIFLFFDVLSLDPPPFSTLVIFLTTFDHRLQLRNFTYPFCEISETTPVTFFTLLPLTRKNALTSSPSLIFPTFTTDPVAPGIIPFPILRWSLSCTLCTVGSSSTPTRFCGSASDLSSTKRIASSSASFRHDRPTPSA